MKVKFDTIIDRKDALYPKLIIELRRMERLRAKLGPSLLTAYESRFGIPFKLGLLLFKDILFFHTYIRHFQS